MRGGMLLTSACRRAFKKEEWNSIGEFTIQTVSAGSCTKGNPHIFSGLLVVAIDKSGE